MTSGSTRLAARWGYLKDLTKRNRNCHHVASPGGRCVHFRTRNGGDIPLRSSRESLARKCVSHMVVQPNPYGAASSVEEQHQGAEHQEGTHDGKSDDAYMFGRLVDVPKQIDQEADHARPPLVRRLLLCEMPFPSMALLVAT
jgi:hypothetical protein